jgi:hypothetical protein
MYDPSPVPPPWPDKNLLGGKGVYLPEPTRRQTVEWLPDGFRDIVSCPRD